jgi:hypothetical protein
MKLLTHQPRVDNEIPSWCAFTEVAPIVRFSAFEILATPIFFLARDLNSRTSEEVHERRTTFFFLAGIIGSLVEGARLLTQMPRLAMPDMSRECAATLRRESEKVRVSSATSSATSNTLNLTVPNSGSVVIAQDSGNSSTKTYSGAPTMTTDSTFNVTKLAHALAWLQEALL